jgi:hypothetical protein
MEKTLVQRTEVMKRGSSRAGHVVFAEEVLLRKTFDEVSLVMFVSESCGVSHYVLGPGSLLVRAWFWLSRCALMVFPPFSFLW